MSRPEVRVPTTTAVLHTERTVLRGFRPGDVAERRALGLDPDIIEMFGGTPDFEEPVAMSAAQAREWYDEHAGAEPTALHWVVELDGRLVGTTRLHSLRVDDAKAMFGIGLLDRTCWGRGLGEEVTRRVVRYGVEEVGLHRIGLKVFAHHERAIRLYTRCGFVVEGREREAAYVRGAWRDDVIMGILASEVPS